MPELPEVEHLRRSLVDGLVGARVERAHILRADIVRLPSDRKGVRGGDLLEGSTITSLDRLGKQLAIIAADGRGLVVQLGMTGQMRWADESDSPPARQAHVHVRWIVRDSSGRTRVIEFRDPRRFGKISPFRSRADLDSRLWGGLGPDAFHADATSLAGSLRTVARRSRRPLKSMLLDQAVVAGLGNIYVDEVLFAAGLHPRLQAIRLDEIHAGRLALEIKAILQRAIDAGGSTLRDYLDATGRKGSFQDAHRVYGRGGLPCTGCQATLASGILAGRSTVWCPVCQPRSRRTSRSTSSST